MADEISGCFVALDVEPSVAVDGRRMRELKRKIEALAGVKEVHSVNGVYDLVVLADTSGIPKETTDMDYIRKTLMPSMRYIPGVRHTLTHILHSYNP